VEWKRKRILLSFKYAKKKKRKRKIMILYELLFEGEYLNGKRWNGKGKEYDSDGKLLFKGEYSNGIKSKI